MKQHLTKRVLSLLLALAMVLSFAVPAQASENSTTVRFEQADNSAVSVNLLHERAETETNEPAYAETDMVRVSIVLQEDSTVEAGYSTQDITDNAQAMAYRDDLRQKQDLVTASIEKATGNALDVVWNLTLAANIISANVEYGQIAAIEQVKGVEQVLLETRYSPDVVSKDETAQPNMATSSAQIGSNVAWAAGYTGAGSRIAVIDTGSDLNHQAFHEGAFLYSLAYQAGVQNLTIDAYLEKLDLLDAAEIASLAGELNVAIDVNEAYFNAKAPFGYNYVDGDYDILHINDMQGEHGSHVAGIATANAYVPAEDGLYLHTMASTMVQGVAPDAQLLTMKVFGKTGGAYDSDYMAAIEDAIVLGADAINLSLGAGNPGSSRNATAQYQKILESLVNSGAVVAMSAGNSGAWVDSANNLGYLYADDVSMQTNGAPGSFTNSLSVASVDNDGTTGPYITVDGQMMVYTESQYYNEPFTTIAGEHEYVFIDGVGDMADWMPIKDVLRGKIAICSRGSINFADKASYAVYYGASATLIYNNQAGVINMDLTDYYRKNPVASLTQADAAIIKAASTPVTDESGNVLYYTGKLTVSSGMGMAQYNSEYYTMSSFSSWGVPTSLELKPEIAAPGGGIYSVYGQTPAGGGLDQYEGMSGTSMAAPQVAGMAAVVAQYIRENGLEEKTGLDNRTLAQSLLMSTAVPVVDGNSSTYYPVIQQGAGLANVGAAVSADSYILMDENATKSYADGKVKVELGDDPQKKGEYTFSFNLHNLTDVEKTFHLQADFFTQDIFASFANDTYNLDELANYMDYLAVNLPVNTTWVVDGKTLQPSDKVAGLDFDGNSTVNTADGQALLDYVVGIREEIQNPDKADLDADGDVDTQDAYLFFRELTTGTAIVPADGAVKVTVTVELTEAWDEHLSYSGTGIYVEGYIFASSLSTAEGVKGTVHSIPVLGFYGNWSDPSMFEVGTYHEYATGDEIRSTYLGDENVNAFFLSLDKKSGVEYYFGGNPLVPDDTYRPERNAINSENGSSISSVSFAAIRNAAASRFTAINKTTGETMLNMNTGEFGTAFYYVNGGYWTRISNDLRTSFYPTGAAEGDKLEVSLTLAPEYNVDAEGKVNWDALGEGASFTLPVVVDNTAPVLERVMIDLTNNSLVAIASDNQYIAAVALYNRSGTRLHTYTGAKQDIQPGEKAEYALDLSNVNGKRFMLQVMDYAMNTTTYAIEMQIGDAGNLPEMMAFDVDKGYWVSLNKDTTKDDLKTYDDTDLTIYAATIVDHVVLASTNEGVLYAMPEDDLADMTRVGKLDRVITDMAYNPADGKVYGVSEDSVLVTIDKLTGKVTEICDIRLGYSAYTTNTLACDENGTFYCNAYGTGSVYSFTLDNMASAQRVCSVGIESEFVQALEINPNTGKLWWISFTIYTFDLFGLSYPFSYLYEIDPATGKYTEYNDLWDEICALIIPERASGSSGNWSDPTDKVSGLELTHTTLDLLKGNSKELVATVQPWTVTDNTVTWSTADETIATVDEDGLVTGVGVGTTTITATSNLDPSVTATCTVKVDTLNVTVKGMLQDAEGNSEFFTWNMETDETWTAGNAIDTSLAAATYNKKANTYYVMDAVNNLWAMHKMGADGVTVANSGANGAGVPLWDLAYSDYFSETRKEEQISSIYNYFFLTPKDPMNMNAMAFDLGYDVGWLTAITSLGYEEFTDDSGNKYDTEHIVLLDNYANVIDFWIYEDTEGMTGFMSFTPSDLELPFLGYNGMYMYCSLVAGEDGALYLSAFQDVTNELYRLTYDALTKKYTATPIGQMGQGVWPAILTEVTSNAPTADGNRTAPEATEKLVARQITAEELQASKLPEANTAAMVYTVTEEALSAKAEAEVKPDSNSTVGDKEQTVTVTVTTDAATNNGLATVTWDETKLALETANLNGNYTAKQEEPGKLTFGYVSMTEIPAGGTVATLTFKVLETEKTTVTVEHKQVNNTAGTTETVIVEFKHENTEIRGKVEPTCTTAGYSGDTYCLDCGKLVKQGEIIEATGHTYGEWQVTKPAACEVPGEEARYCDDCGARETRIIPATGHTFGEWTLTKAPTCTEKGIETRTCVCGETETREVAATGHSFGEWKVTKEATCTENGEETRTCACGETETRVVPAHGHNAESVVVAPTCEEDGYTEHTCQVCGESWRDTIVPALGHEYEAVVTAPTCTEKGYTTYICTVCGESYVADEVPATGHSFGEWVVTVPATCTTEGEETRTCACGEVETRSIPAFCATADYTDVPLNAWYHDAVDFVVANGIMEGIDEGIFDPNGTTTRAQLVTVLYRLEGEPEVELTEQFADVAEGAWYAEAVAWAYENGITTGVTETAFAPNASVTREQVVVFLARYAEFKGIDTASQYDLSDFADASTVKPYATSAFRWAVENGIINGMDGYLAPVATSTRAQIATILMRFVQG